MSTIYTLDLKYDTILMVFDNNTIKLNFFVCTVKELEDLKLSLLNKENYEINIMGGLFIIKNNIIELEIRSNEYEIQFENFNLDEFLINLDILITKFKKKERSQFKLSISIVSYFHRERLIRENPTFTIDEIDNEIINMIKNMIPEELNKLYMDYLHIFPINMNTNKIIINEKLNILKLKEIPRTKDTLKKQYKKLALKLHPDMNINIDTTLKFQNLCNAFEYINSLIPE
jgi:hypothetical protein